MKKLSLILVALATMVMVGCKPLTGSTVCPHDWNLTDEVAPTCATNGVKTYTCTLCGDKQYEPIPATGNHTWVDTDFTEDKKVTSAKYYLKDGVLTFEKVEVSPKYKCSICGETHDKNVAFFNSDTTIGKAIGVSCDKWKEPELPLNDTWTVEKYNSYYDEVVKNKGKSDYISYCNCKCIHDVGKGNTCSCVDDCTCGDPDNCVRSCGNYVFFGSYYIKY